MRRSLALIGAILLSCGSGASTTSAAPSAAGSQATAAPATSAAAARTSAPAASASAAAGRADVLLKWDTGANISDVDDITEIVSKLKQRPGILGGFGDENQITITYEPRTITVDQIRAILRDMGHPTKAP